MRAVMTRASQGMKCVRIARVVVKAAHGPSAAASAWSSNAPAAITMSAAASAAGSAAAAAAAAVRPAPSREARHTSRRDRPTSSMTSLRSAERAAPARGPPTAADSNCRIAPTTTSQQRSTQSPASGGADAAERSRSLAEDNAAAATARQRSSTTLSHADWMVGTTPSVFIASRY
eukprot:scaffold25800_cov24-Tisochrysis_lutea.AAC.2